MELHQESESCQEKKDDGVWNLHNDAAEVG